MNYFVPLWKITHALRRAKSRFSPLLKVPAFTKARGSERIARAAS